MSTLIEATPPIASPAPPLGARLVPQGTEFRVWAPAARQVDVVFPDTETSVPLTPRHNGFFVGLVPGVGEGSRYLYRLDGGKTYPDPCSRYQPEGPHGPSQVVDPFAYRWRDADWRGVTMKGQVIYELHIGTFTREGTFDAACERLADLKALGITLIEVMPIAEWAGRWNWGYDGVDFFAPSHQYGPYDTFKHFVDTAHQLGLGVILDVVYNHSGPDGCYLTCFSKSYFSDRHKTDWGPAFNFDGPDAAPVRAFFVENATYWIREFHLDGLRLDATQNIYDDSPRPILGEIADTARAAAGSRSIVLIAENEPQDLRCLRPSRVGGFGLDAMWNDDFHHTARVALTGFREAYYTDYPGQARDLLACIKRGFLYQGQYYRWQKQPRGTLVTQEPAYHFVIYLQNHDQVANFLPTQRPDRKAPPGLWRTLTMVWLLAPETPMFFMGQEFGATTPFTFFADHKGELASQVHQGRKAFLSQFKSFKGRLLESTPNPADRATFESSQLDWSEQKKHGPLVRFHKDLLARRRSDPVLSAQDRIALDGTVLGETILVLRYFGGSQRDRLLVANLGIAQTLHELPEPLLAPPANHRWQDLFSSDDKLYGGKGRSLAFDPLPVTIPEQSAFFYSAEPLP